MKTSHMILNAESNKILVSEKLDAARAARTIASRLCVPRDMSAPAAKILRAVLMTAAEELESK